MKHKKKMRAAPGQREAARRVRFRFTAALNLAFDTSSSKKPSYEIVENVYRLILAEESRVSES